MSSPAKATKAKRNVRFTIPVAVSDEDMELLQSYAAGDKLTVSEWVRRQCKLPERKRGRPPKPVVVEDLASATRAKTRKAR